MKKEKARKNLTFYRETFEYWKEQYLYYVRKKNSIMDIKYSGHDKTMREEFIEDALNEMNDCKVKIAEYERIVK